MRTLCVRGGWIKRIASGLKAGRADGAIVLEDNVRKYVGIALQAPPNVRKLPFFKTVAIGQSFEKRLIWVNLPTTPGSGMTAQSSGRKR
jgi:hypothetical protein